ncbi:MAG: crosslink repair DNA glycosylase YcaQ family protein [Spirochaetales bacterium]
MSLALSTDEARRLALAAASGWQGLPAKLAAKQVPAAVTALVERLGFVQIDTISVVERAHHHILGARLPGYRPEWLDQAEVFEYWGHAASYLPWSDFRYTLPRKARVKENGHDWYKLERADADRVLERIKAEGPLRSQDFEDAQGRAGWWDWKPAKRALEYLFMSGQLMILPRQGFQKVFDLTERVLPLGVDTREPSAAETAHHYLDRALDLWGLVARDEVAYQRREHTDLVGPLLAERTAAGDLVKLTVEGSDRPYWARPKSLEALDTLPGPENTLRILSPFDPFVIHRKRLLRLFGYDLKLECYVPAPKRTFGYFGLPLLWRGQIAGLLDAKLDRKAGTLTVRNLRYDGPAKQKKAFDTAMSKALEIYRKRLLS